MLDLIDDTVRCDVMVSLFAVNICNLRVFLVAVKNVAKVIVRQKMWTCAEHQCA